nr:PREDICTED: von Willebrand factor A domain-containing protein 9-like [Bemisia tabaci]
MPTVIVLDVSLSMACPVANSESGEVYTRLQLAVKGINSLLDYLALHCKLEFVALMTYSSLVDVINPFTRDFDQIKSKLSQIIELDKTCYEPVLTAINGFVLREWGSSTPCQVCVSSCVMSDCSFSV